MVQRTTTRRTMLAGAAALGLAPALPPGPARGAGFPVVTGCRADRTLSGMSLEEQVGQMFMVGTPATAASSAVLDQIGRYHVGSVMLTGRSTTGVSATARVTAALQARARAVGDPPLVIATDQEGGAVQVLQGPGFARLPSATEQGRWSTQTLREAPVSWAGQLRSAGVNANLAPVLDTVPSATYPNPPVGDWDRNYAFTAAGVTEKGVAVMSGWRGGRVATAVKHFPGLGLVPANTDTTSVVRDTTITTTHSYLAPFRAAIQQGTDMVMMSSAYYDRIDPVNPAALSRPVVTDLLRGSLGFRGVVISDDLGAARAMTAIAIDARASRFVAAGGDLLLTVTPTPLPQMVEAVLRRARSDAAWRAKVYAAARRVLTMKENLGLLGDPCWGNG